MNPKQKLPFTVLASAANTSADRTSERFLNEAASGLDIRQVISAYTNPGGPGAVLTFQIEVQIQLANGDWVRIWQAGATVAANGTSLYLLSDTGHTNIGAFTEVEDMPLPLGYWRIVIDVVNGDVNNFATTLVDAQYVE